MVLQASKFTLREVFKTLGVKKANDFVQTHLVDEGRLYLEEFLAALARLLAEERPRALAACLRAAGYHLLAAAPRRHHAPLLLGASPCPALSDRRETAHAAHR